MSGRGKEVHAFYQKICTIAEGLQLKSQDEDDQREWSSDRPTAFSMYALIHPNTLNAAINAGRCTDKLAALIAKAARFDLNHYTWIDPDIDPSTRSSPDNIDYPGRDSASGFRSYYFRALGLAMPHRRLESQPPRLIDDNLATFTVDDGRQSTMPDQGINLFFTAVLEQGRHPAGFVYGFRRVRLRLRRKKGNAQFLQSAETVELKGAKLVARGTPHNPEWFLEEPNGRLDGEYATKSPLALMIGTDIGHQIVAELSFQTMDGSLVELEGAPLTDENQKLVIAALFEEQLPEVRDSQGWRSLGTQLITVMRGDR
ncbi:hypothetical protein [Rhizobium leguminosarum]|uniref:hypothetical protein n=1 Tax=Rhizobium leguminosarum TaxID=384 RepID=UPI00102F7465|nr:hypothetical protein [Rhizobium leguminosarum]TBG66559.1 hypothetical protein ELG74_01080 [Rhizobium leguminosarum]